MIKTLAAALLLASFATAAHAEIAGNTVTIGVLTDMNAGNADATGQGSVVAAQLAVEDAKTFLPGVKIDVINADHQNKPDIAASIAREWVSKGVNVIADVPFSSAGLAVSEATRNAPRSIFIASGTGTSDLTGKVCSPNTVHWTYDTYATGNAVARALIGQGLKTWFFITADYAFGAALERDTSQGIAALGGTVLGHVKNPPFAADFSLYVLTAQNSKADVIAIANASIDFINIVKQAREFGINNGPQRLAALLTLITDVQSLGLEAAQGLYLASPFYWDLNDLYARVLGPVLRAHARPQADHAPGRRLFRCVALSQGRAGHRQHRGRVGRGCHGTFAGRRRRVRQGVCSQGRPGAARLPSVPGEGAVRVEGAVGRLQVNLDRSRRPGIPPARRGRLPAGEIIHATNQRVDAPRASNRNDQVDR